MEKRGQFYLVTVLIIAVIFLGLIVTQNKVVLTKQNPLSNTQNQLSIETTHLLDYIAQNDINYTQSNSLFDNFSKTYVDEIGKDKNTIFFYGNQSVLNIYANSAGDENISCNFSGKIVEIVNSTYSGIIQKNENLLTKNNFSCLVNSGEISYELNFGRNIYYLILYKYNNGVYTISN